MTDLIDRQVLLLILKKNDEEYWNSKGGGYAVSQDIIDEIRFMPKVDTERHAHWNDDFSFKSNAKRVDICSCCKSAIYRDIDSDKYNYCPTCGAKMDEDKK